MLVPTAIKCAVLTAPRGTKSVVVDVMVKRRGIRPRQVWFREIVSRTRRKARCCTKDEGRSLGAALWEEAPNRRKLLRLKDAVVNVPVKRRGMIASGADWEGERK